MAVSGGKPAFPLENAVAGAIRQPDHRVRCAAVADHRSLGWSPDWLQRLARELQGGREPLDYLAHAGPGSGGIYLQVRSAGAERFGGWGFAALDALGCGWFHQPSFRTL